LSTRIEGVSYMFNREEGRLHTWHLYMEHGQRLYQRVQEHCTLYIEV